MPFEKGGRADKQGNRYEINCIIYEILKVLDETNYSVIIETIGIDEIGTDILVTTFDGQKEHQQCKARNASKRHWDISDLKSKNLFYAWKTQLNRDTNRYVSLVSPIECSFLIDLHNRACNTSGKAEDFYLVQIKKSSKDFQKFYENFCIEMDLNIEDKSDILKSIDYLKRIYYKQMSEYELQERINQNIQFLFSSETERVYNALVAFVVMGDILGIQITQTLLYEYFSSRKISFRLNDGDRRIVPRINEINQEYRAYFRPLQGGIIYRKEFDECIEAVKNEKGIIVSGSAGYGKSGCTEAILDYCEEKKIPHIAIKLDRRIPHKNCEIWGKELGFPSSIVHSIHCVSKNENAVIILDQLDALRWTQTNSSEALAVCMELIRQVKYLNYERKKKIIIVFVCRTYDLENDNNINSLFQCKETSEKEWKIVKIEHFQEDTVKEIIGKNYDSLSFKLKKILKIPSNLYIWQHLDKEEDYGECLTTSHLIDKWFEQICRKSVAAGLLQDSVNKTKKNIVDVLDRTGRLFVPKSMLDVDEAGLDYLISSEILVAQNNKVGFVHQSILDYFISQKMIEKYIEGYSIDNIIGDKDKQTPGRRYQVQMFLQNLLEYDSGDFILFGTQMLVSNNIRYYVKYVFFEILGQIQEPDDNIIQFVLENCENNIYGNYLLDNTIFGRKQYIKILRNYGILERWYSIPEKRDVVFNLLQSITPVLDEEDIMFIKRHAFCEENDDKQFMKCFLYDITQESEKMFELRLMFYERYPVYAKEVYIDVKNMTVGYEKKIIRLISFWLRNKIKNQDNSLYRYEEELDFSDGSVFEENVELTLNELIPYIPKDSGWQVKYSDWAGGYYKRNIERACVSLIEKATKVMCCKYPERFWEIYEPYMGQGYYVFNELILKGFAALPSGYSNRIIRYLSSDIDNKMFDYTSGAEDILGLVKEVLKIHGKNCDVDEFSMIENSISFYISPNASEWYKQRIEQNKSKEYPSVYWSFWGDLQYELLRCLPEERIGKRTKELLCVLCRRFNKIPSRYYSMDGHSGWVKSPVSGKKISKGQWLQIITNGKLKNRTQSKWIEVKGGFIESSYEMYANDFQSVVRECPVEMVKLVLANKERVLPAFIDALFSGVNVSEKLDSDDHDVIEKLFLEYPCDMNSHRASYFCGIIEKMSWTGWSEPVIKQLHDIALQHCDPQLDKPNVTNSEDQKIKSCEMLHSNALNCVRGRAARAIGHLLWEDKRLFSKFQEVLEGLVKDENPAVRFASFYALWPSYNIEREWTEKRIMDLYESDIRMASFQDSKNMFFLLYPRYREKVIKIITKSFESEDKQLIAMGGHAVCEFYIRHGEFETIVFSAESRSEDQTKAILDMAVVYLNIDDYREVAKDIILTYKNTDMDIGFPLSRMFDDRYIDLKRDRQFMQEFMKTKVSRRIVRAFVRFLEGNALSVVDYAEIIIQLCENVLHMEKEEMKKQWGIEDEISKLIIALYDETANSTIISYKQIASRCLDLWDVMFERQIGAVREVSRKLTER